MTLPTYTPTPQEKPGLQGPISFWKSLTSGQKFTLASLLFLLLALPLAVLLSLRETKPDSQASELTNPAIVTFTPENPVVAPNESFEISVGLETAGKLISAAEITVGYSSDQIEVEAVEIGEFLPVELEPATIDASTATGRVHFIVGSKPESPPEGTGEIAILRLKAKNQLDEGSPITTMETITRIAAVGFEQAIPSGQRPAYITIQEPPTPTPIPTSTPQPTPEVTPTPTPTPFIQPGLRELSTIEIRLRAQGIQEGSQISKIPEFEIILEKAIPEQPSDIPFNVQEIQRVLTGTEIRLPEDATPQRARDIIKARIDHFNAIPEQALPTFSDLIQREMPKLKEALARVNLYFPTFTLTPDFTFASGVFTTQFQVFSPGILYNIYAESPLHLKTLVRRLTISSDIPGLPLVLTETNNPTLIPGDISSNEDSANKIDIFDYNLMVSHFGPRMPEDGSPADLNFDGDVDIFDYNLIVSNFGKTGEGATQTTSPNSTQPNPTPLNTSIPLPPNPPTL